LKTGKKLETGSCNHFTYINKYMNAILN